MDPKYSPYVKMLAGQIAEARSDDRITEILTEARETLKNKGWDDQGISKLLRGDLVVYIKEQYYGVSDATHSRIQDIFDRWDQEAK